ncbi:MAG: hypothetical protein A2Z38_11170 [Planctomycetes bacterium RBG_19FT_COMBO_48_8]|nr:MAG: hypothetical protein A2Z38_11170 [Planctomycetes bacterium RBG_19FT_COMBO_48_8]
MKGCKRRTVFQVAGHRAKNYIYAALGGKTANILQVPLEVIVNDLQASIPRPDLLIEKHFQAAPNLRGITGGFTFSLSFCLSIFLEEAAVLFFAGK